MTDCDICRILENKDAFKVVYQDDDTIAIMHESPAVAGHILVIPIKHYPIFEEVPEDVLKLSFGVANALSVAMFDTLDLQGTNLIVNNGLSAGQEHAHFMIHVIPRKEGDGLNFEWNTKKMSDEGLKSSLNMIRTYADAIFTDGGMDLSKISIKKKKKSIVKKEEDIDYQVKQLRRLP